MIKTRRLILNEISHNDINEIHYLNSQLKVADFNTTGVPKDIEETKNELKLYFVDHEKKERRNYYWTIRNLEDNSFYGFIGMNIFADRFKLAKIFFSIMPIYWGNGYATESAQAIISFGFDKLLLHRIEAGCAIDNYMSIRVLNKCNMTNEGIRRKLLPIKREWKDCVHFSILESDKRNY